jgi:organic radical activating enzyme
MDLLGITEYFHSIQGEGKYIGQPSLFIRVGGCTLSCPFCDTKYSSKDNFKAKYILKNYDDIKNFVDIAINDIKKENSLPNRAVITGGEPLKRETLDLVCEMTVYLFYKYGMKTTFETTLILDEMDIKKSNVLSSVVEIKNKIDEKMEEYHLSSSLHEIFNFSCSPKLDVNCYKTDVKNNDILIFYDWQLVIDGHDFYFLGYSDFADIINYKIIYHKKYKEIIYDFIHMYKENFRKDIYLMSLTPFPFKEEENLKNCLETVEFCKKHNLKYSPREHINLWGLKKGI